MKEYPNQSMDDESLSEALAFACQQDKDKELMKEVQEALEKNNISISLSNNNEADPHQGEEKEKKKIRFFARKLYRN